MTLNVAYTSSGCLVIAPEPCLGVWVQGCSIHCPECNAKALWPFESRDYWNEDRLVDLAISSGVQSMAILGGEPLDQSAATEALCLAAREADLGVVLYTGYEWERVRKSHSWIASTVDLLIAGPFVAERCDTVKRFVGSDNQELITLSPRYKKMDLEERERPVEFHILDDGSVDVFGYPSEQLLSELTGGNHT